MKKVKIWLIVIPIIISALGISVFFLGKPIWGTVSSLIKVKNTKGYSFEANLDLDMDYISDQLGKASILTRLIPDLRLVEVKGVWRDGDAHAYVYPFGQEAKDREKTEFTDIYYVDGEYFINLQKILDYLEGKLGFLAKLTKIEFPDYTGAEYISYSELCRLFEGIGDLFTKGGNNEPETVSSGIWKNIKFKSFEDGTLNFQWIGEPFIAEAHLEEKDGNLSIPFESIEHPFKCVMNCYGTIYVDDSPLEIESFTKCNLEPLVDLFKYLQSSAV